MVAATMSLLFIHPGQNRRMRSKQLQDESMLSDCSESFLEVFEILKEQKETLVHFYFEQQ